MLLPLNDHFNRHEPHGSGLMPNVSRDLSRLLAAVRRQLAVVFLCCVLACAVGIVYVYSLVPRYTASTFVLIDNRRIRAVENAYDVSSSYDVAGSVVDSQVEVIKSAQVAEALVRKLNLLEKQALQSPPSPGLLKLAKSHIKVLWAKLSGAPAKDMPPTRTPSIQQAIAAVQRGLDVSRVGRTMVLQISYTSESPSNAAEMANAYADAYLSDQLNAKYEATKRASQWLEERLAELKQKALTADLALQKFRAENNLILSGGKLINEQQLTELNAQLAVAHGERAKAESRYQRIETIIRLRETKAVVNEAIGNTQIEQLRSKYLEASKRESDLSAKVGSSHLSTVGLRAEMAEYERLMFSELSRVAEGYRSEVDIAKAKEVTLVESVDKLIAIAAKENKSLVTLREIEREGDAFRNLYQTYLQRYQESLQQQTFPIIEARTISPASEPLGASYPKKGVMMILFCIMGGAIGTVVGMYREFREKGFKSEEQVRDYLNVECLGIVPIAIVKGASTLRTKKKLGPYTRGQTAGLTERALGRERQPQAPDAQLTMVSDTEIATDPPRPARHIEESAGVMAYSMDRPNSAFTETLLAVKLASDVKLSDNTSKIIGVISALPGEGKTAFSKNLASMFASLNAKTLLIDADLRKPELSRKLAPDATEGLLEAVIGHRDLRDLIWHEERSGLAFLPTVSKTRVPHSSALLASAGMHRLLEEAQQHFDYIVIDLPPFGPVVDVRAIASQIQAFALVVEWRKTGRKVVRNILMENEQILDKCLGVVLNKVNVNKLKLFEEHGSRYYYFRKYTKSYYMET